MAARPPGLDRLKALCTSGRHEAALKGLAALARTHPRNPEVLYHLGLAQTRSNRYKEGDRTLAKAAALAPKAHQPVYELAFSYRRQGRMDEARRAFEKALALSGGEAVVAGALADLLLLAGDEAGARAIVTDHLASGELNVLDVHARLCARDGHHADAIDLLRASTDDAGTTDGVRAHLLFRLAILHDAIGDYDEAFACAARANTIVAAPFDARAHARAIDELIAAWTPEAMRAIPRPRVLSDSPVFIVGMPRSGTSLVEQILDAHPLVHGAGERPELSAIANALAAQSGRPALTDLGVLTRSTLERAAGDYLAALSRGAPRVRHITDKAPFNFLHLGFIACAMPRARIVHCARSPVDTCLSIFFQRFTNGPVGGGTLAGIGAVYRDYARLMHHWRTALEAPMCEVCYESLVQNPAENVRRMLDDLGLPWDDACMRFHESKRPTITASAEQVRKPIYTTSLDRRRHYERHTGELLDALGDLAA